MSKSIPWKPRLLRVIFWSVQNCAKITLFALTWLCSTCRLSNYVMAKCVRSYQIHANRIYCVIPTFSVWFRLSVTNGKYIVSGSENHCIYLCDLQGKNILHKLEGHTDTLISVTCHLKWKMIASAGSDNDRTIRIWVQDKWFCQRVSLSALALPYPCHIVIG